MESFQTETRRALADKNLRRAIDKATDQMNTRRLESFASLENADLIRDMARRAKMDVLRDLDGNLLKFERRLIENGMQVHWAETGEDANTAVLEIARKHGIQKIVKSKSMVSEEILLNNALISEGLRVVETDFGEYIVQLAEDRPSHIIAPIIHLSRKKVGELMHKKLGVPYTDDIQRLARHARERLRKEFLSAEMGISGANFGVVDTGTICLVTNEGNGRMVTTLPRIHVVLMGIEKLVSTLADLDLFLKILARSGAGQKLTSYTTLIQGPNRRQDRSGSEEVHVILLDNGRTSLLGGEQAEILACIRCGACLNVCPIYKSIGGHAYGDVYPGPVGSIVTPGLRGLSGWTELPYASTLCGACRDACPVRLDIPTMLLSLRKSAVDTEKMPAGLRIAMKLFGIAATHPRVYRAVTRFGSRCLGIFGGNMWMKRLPCMFGSWTKVRDFRKPARISFQEQWSARIREHGQSDS